MRRSAKSIDKEIEGIILKVMKNMGILDCDPYLSMRRNIQLENEINKNLPQNCWIRIYDPI